MPTKAFFNLSFSKREQLLESAEKEFSNNLFEKASVNKIIKDINMPRGSFYLYFKNKEDIYMFVLEEHLKKMKKELLEILNKNNNDIFKSLICMFDILISNKSIEHKLMANIFINMNPKNLDFVVPAMLKKETSGYIIESIDFSNYSITTDEKIIVLSIVFPIFFTSVGKVLSNFDDKQQIRNFYIKQMNIIKRGLERKI